MKAIFPITFALGCILALPVSSSAQSPGAQNTSLNHRELKKLEREANTPAQFKELADYFRGQEHKFRAKAADMKTEWERRSQNVSGPNAKAFRPVDSARNLYEYYQYEADHAAQLATQYEQRAGGNMPPGGAAA